MSDPEDGRPAVAGGPAENGSRRTRLDLRGVLCPLSWARAKVRLESLERGDELALLLDDPKGVRDIPLAAEAEGYAVGEAKAESGCWVITITV